MGILTLYGTKK
jgi:hypothetical protein